MPQSPSVWRRHGVRVPDFGENRQQYAQGFRELRKGGCLQHRRAVFLKVWRELPHPRAVIDDPENADVPENASALIALCGSLYRMADDVNLGSIVSYAMRLRREVGEFLVGSCVRREPALQHTDAFIRWAAARTQ